jgi:MFS family permease
MFTQAAARYSSFLQMQDVARLLVTAFVTRLPLGTLTLSMLMHVRALSGSFATAGAAVGAYLAAAALTAPIQGRVIDRRGPRPILLLTGVLCPLALVVLLAAAPLALSDAALIGMAALAGAFAAPISVLTRTMWRYRFDDERQRTMAFALDGVLIELAFTLGPAIVALLLAFASAQAAFAAAVCFTALAVPLFVLSPALKYWHHQPDEERHLLGPLTEPRLLVVYASTFLFTLSLGLTEVGYPGFAAAAGMVPLAGVLLAVNSLGSAVGGLIYGAAHIALPAERQLARFLAAMIPPLALQALTGSPWLLAGLAFAAGLLIAPVFALSAILVTRIAPPRYATEAFTWLATCIVSGVGAGTALGGRLLEGPGAAAAFALAAGAALAAALCSALLRFSALRLRRQI